jgi:hypothetical protein
MVERVCAARAADIGSPTVCGAVFRISCTMPQQSANVGVLSQAPNTPNLRLHGPSLCFLATVVRVGWLNSVISYRHFTGKQQSANVGVLSQAPNTPNLRLHGPSLCFLATVVRVNMRPVAPTAARLAELRDQLPALHREAADALGGADILLVATGAGK